MNGPVVRAAGGAAVEDAVGDSERDSEMAPTKTVHQLTPRRVRWHDHDGQVVIHGPKAPAIALNPTAAMLWRRLVEGADRNALVASLMNEFDIDTLTATSDVDAFLAGLAAHGLLAEAV